MFLTRRPAAAFVERFLDAQAASALSYAPVGLSALRPPGFAVDHQRVLLGTGPEAFAAARAALRAWTMFRLGWVRLYPPGAPIDVGTNVAVLAHHLGFWSLNACRVVLSDADTDTRLGFAYGTLADHVERGEELFAVELDPRDGRVWYELRAVSRPGALLARLGYPLARRLQARFRRDSARAMRAAVPAAAEAPSRPRHQP